MGSRQWQQGYSARDARLFLPLLSIFFFFTFLFFALFFEFSLCFFFPTWFCVPKDECVGVRSMWNGLVVGPVLLAGGFGSLGLLKAQSTGFDTSTAYLGN